MKKCKNFLVTLIKLASSDPQAAGMANNVRGLVRALLVRLPLLRVSPLFSGPPLCPIRSCDFSFLDCILVSCRKERLKQKSLLNSFIRN